MDPQAFAQKLAANTKTDRDRATKILRRYIVAKSKEPQEGFKDDDLLKIWKGLFYCMYMADKPLVQEELSETISELIHNFGNRNDCYRFIRQAFITFAREWDNIDVFRVDKYMMLVRRFLRQIFVHLHLCDYELKEVTEISNILDTSVVAGGDHLHIVPLGLKLHVTKIFLEELAKIGGEELPSEVICTLLKPFMKALVLAEDLRYVKAIEDNIFKELMRQTDLGIKHRMAEELGEDPDDLEVNGEEEEDLDFDEEDEDDLDDDDEEEDFDVDEEEEDFDVDDDEEEDSEEELEEQVDEEEEDVELEGDGGEGQSVLEKLEKEINEEELNRETSNPQEKEKIIDTDGQGNISDDNGSHKDGNENQDEVKEKVEEVSELLAAVATSDKEDQEREEEEEEGQDEQEEDEEEEEDESDGEVALDPRAGGVDVELPQLNPDFCDLAEMLAAVTNVKRVRHVNKKVAKKLVNSMLDLTAGVYPLAARRLQKIPSKHLKIDEEASLHRLEHGLEDPSVDLRDKKDKEKMKIKKQKRRYKKKAKEEARIARQLKYQGKERTEQDYLEQKRRAFKELKKLKKVRVKGVSKELDLPMANPKSPYRQASKLLKGQKSKSKEKENLKNTTDRKKKGQKQKGQSEGPSGKKTDFHVTNITNSKKPVAKSRNSFEVTELKTTTPKKRAGDFITINIPNKKNKLETTGIGKSNISNGMVKALEKPKEKSSTKGNIKTKAQKSSATQPNKNSVSNGTSLNSSKKPFEKPKAAKENGQAISTKNVKGKKGKGATQNKKPMQNGKIPNGGAAKEAAKNKPSAWDAPLQKGEVEIFIKSRKQIDKEKKSNTIRVATKEIQREKSIRINLRQNKEHEFSDYARTLKNSPSIPFSADKLPKAPVLKPSPSPILVKKAPKRLLRVIEKTASPKSKRPKAHDFF